MPEPCSVLSPQEQAFVDHFVAYPHSVDQNDDAIARKIAREVGLPDGIDLRAPRLVAAIQARLSEPHFTPGPWHYRSVDGPFDPDAGIRDAEGRAIAVSVWCGLAEDQRARRAANIYAIAAVPEMAAFVRKHAQAGDVDAQALWGKINGRGA